MIEIRFPRLLYIGDTPIEASYAGCALLYRLLEGYPAERLEIVETGTRASRPERRIKGVRYTDATLPFARLQTTRLASWYARARLLAAPYRTYNFRDILARFRPEAILTLTNGISWISAATLAEEHGLPLHLICHDEWSYYLPAATGLRASADRVFGRHYRRAASRLCVSSFMARSFEERYGAKGNVLYPSRAASATRYGAPPARLGTSGGPITVAFAGTISSVGMVAALRSLARCLQAVDGRLLIFGPLDVADARGSGLDALNIELGGWAAKLMEALRERADVLFVPMSFTPEDRANMEICFPSKLADYTAVGLPLLIYGPSYCSAVQWAIANDRVAEVVSTESETDLSSALSRLASDPSHRFALACRALEVGDRYFSHAAALEVFHAALGVAPRPTEDAGAPMRQPIRSRLS